MPGAVLPVSGQTLPGAAGSNGHAFGIIERLYIGLIDSVSATYDPPALEFGTTAPTTLYRTKGSLVFNQTLTAGHALAWVTTVAGTPGTQAIAVFQDDPVTALTPQTQTDWNDTADTDSGTAAAKARVRAYRRQVQTTTNTANQTLFTSP